VICAQCRRPLVRAAVTIGRVTFGPTCASRLGLAGAKPRPVPVRESVARDDGATMDLFWEVERVQEPQ